MLVLDQHGMASGQVGDGIVGCSMLRVVVLRRADTAKSEVNQRLDELQKKDAELAASCAALDECKKQLAMESERASAAEARGIEAGAEKAHLTSDREALAGMLLALLARIVVGEMLVFVDFV